MGQLISSHQPTAQLTPALEVVGFLWGVLNTVLCRVLQSYVNTSQGSPQSDSAGAKSCSSGCVSLDFCLRRWSMGEPREAGPWPSSPRKLWCCYSMGAWKKRLSSSKEQMTARACSVSSGFLSAAALRCDEALPFLLPPHPSPSLNDTIPCMCH